MKGWNAPTRTAWSSQVDRIIQGMKTLRNGEQFGINHAGCSAWKSPTFSLTTRTVSKLPQPCEELSKMRESIRLQKIQLRRMENDKDSRRRMMTLTLMIQIILKHSQYLYLRCLKTLRRTNPAPGITP